MSKLINFGIAQLKKHHYLTKRDGLYFAVIPVPKKLQISSSKQIWRSLHANSYGDAVINLNKEVARVMNYFELLKHHEDVLMLEARHFEMISDKCKAEALQKDQERRIKHFDNDESLHLYEWQKQRDLDSLSVYKTCLATGNYKKVTHLVEKNLASSGIFWQRRDMIFKQLCMEVLKKLIQAYKMIAERYEGEWQDMPYEAPKPAYVAPARPVYNQVEAPKVEHHVEQKRVSITKPQAIPQAAPLAPMLMLGELIKQFNESPEITQKSKAVRVKYGSYQAVLVRCVGEKTDIAEVNRSMFRDLLTTLKCLPKGLQKIGEFKGVEIPKIVERMKYNHTYEKLQPSTINDYLEHLQALMKWAKRDGYDVADDFADIRVKKGNNSKFDRMPFEQTHISLIMNSFEVQESKKDIKTAELYWCLVIALTTGMRIGEICQLRLCDIRNQDEIDYISINVDGDKTLKTLQSVRDIPINKILKQAGFLEYISSIRKTHKDEDWIFPYYKRGENRSGDPISKRFNRLLIRLQIKSKKLTFHSTRHNYRDFVRESDLNQVENNIALELGGWSYEGNTVHGNYGSGYSLKRKLSVINKIKYDELEELI